MRRRHLRATISPLLKTGRRIANPALGAWFQALTRLVPVHVEDFADEELAQA
jgi:hypothetical protein